MKLFCCSSCGHVVFFENVVCERCNHALGFEPQSREMMALESADGIWQAVGSNGGGRWKYCGNYVRGVCNWLIPGDNSDTLCVACRHNLVIPNLRAPRNVALWQKMEQAKRRLFYTILQLGLPLTTRSESPEGLGFEFRTTAADRTKPVMTGHEDGLITIALAEADDAEREKRRHAMGEPYRTLLGHFRHEVGHWYWDRLVRDGGVLAECREVFGNDEEDYGQALQRHYANGPKPSWQNHYVSSYAGAHAWEDFAETWAHYFHIVDTLETGGEWGIMLKPEADRSGLMAVDLDFDIFDGATTIEHISRAWTPLAMALNSFNRSLGHQDLYPFVLSPEVIAKLGFIHELVHGRVGYNRAPVPMQASSAA